MIWLLPCPRNWRSQLAAAWPSPYPCHASGTEQQQQIKQGEQKVIRRLEYESPSKMLFGKTVTWQSWSSSVALWLYLLSSKELRLKRDNLFLLQKFFFLRRWPLCPMSSLCTLGFIVSFGNQDMWAEVSGGERGGLGQQGSGGAILSWSRGGRGAATSPGKSLTMEINTRGWRCETAWPLLTSLLSATMISSTYLVVVWTWRLCCKERAKRGGAREQDRKGTGMIKRGGKREGEDWS